MLRNSAGASARPVPRKGGAGAPGPLARKGFREYFSQARSIEGDGMETRASYTIVGAFTLLAVAGALLFVLWSARNEQGRMRTYEIEFHQSVSGLSVGSAVLLEGVRVGQVSGIKVSPDEPGRVTVRVQVAADAPVRRNSEATLEPQGVTGISAIAVSGGTRDSPLLSASTEGVGRIPSKPSRLQQIMNSAPSILASMDDLVKRAANLLAPENLEGVGRLLASLADIAETLSAGREDMTRGLTGFSEAGQSFSVSGKHLEKLMADARTLVDRDIRGAARSVSRAADTFGSAVEGIEPGLSRLSRDSVDELNRLLVEARRLTSSLAKLTQKLESDPRRFLLGNSVPEFSAP